MHADDLAFYRELEAEARKAFPVGTRVFVKTSHPWGNRTATVIGRPTIAISRGHDRVAIYTRVALDDGGTTGVEPHEMEVRA